MWSVSLLWEMMLGQTLELAWLVSKNYCRLFEAIAINFQVQETSASFC